MTNDLNRNGFITKCSGCLLHEAKLKLGDVGNDFRMEWNKLTGSTIRFRWNGLHIIRGNEWHCNLNERALNGAKEKWRDARSYQDSRNSNQCLVLKVESDQSRNYQTHPKSDCLINYGTANQNVYVLMTWTLFHTQTLGGKGEMSGSGTWSTFGLIIILTILIKSGKHQRVFNVNRDKSRFYSFPAWIHSLSQGTIYKPRRILRKDIFKGSLYAPYNIEMKL